MFAWSGEDKDNIVCDKEFGGVLSASNFMAGWHMAMTIMGLCIFCFMVCILSCADNSYAKPFISCCVCGYDNIENEKRRRRAKAMENQNRRNEEAKHQGHGQQPYAPSGPAGQQNYAPQNYHPQPMHEQPYNPSGASKDPYANQNNAGGYPSPQPMHYDAQAQPVQKDDNNNVNAGPPVAENKGFFGKAKDKLNKFVGNK
jgi:hypothetical protein